MSKELPTSVPTPVTTSKVKLVQEFLGTLALLSPWSLLLFQLSITWKTNEQYAHGYLVPFLCVFLLLKAGPTNSIEKNGGPKASVSKKLWFFVGIPLLLSIVPVWLIRGANSDWRLLNVVLFLLVFALTLLFAYNQNGWSRVKPLIFPISFFFVAIPWPLATDLKLTQWLQEKVSSIIVDGLLILEHEAKLEGTIIDIGVFGEIGVDQACSGIHGLQASIVITLFLGAYYSFGLFNRVVFVLAGVLIALCLNLGRAFSLSYIKIKGKGELLERSLFTIGNWQAPNLHDLVGWIETLFIFLLILFLARTSQGGMFLHTMGTAPSNWSNLRFTPPIAFSSATILIVVGAILGAEFHYSKNEQSMESLPRITLDLKDSDIKTFGQEISNQVAAQLHFKEASSIQWQDKFRLIYSPFTGDFQINPSDEYWQVFEANWDSGGACTAVLSTHSPESCLPLTGLSQISPTPGQDPLLIPVEVNNRKILFEAYEFSRNHRKLSVFRCFWPSKLEPGQPNLFPRGGYSFGGRIESALQGRRNVGGTMLAVAVANINSLQDGINKLNSLANQRIKLIE